MGENMSVQIKELPESIACQGISVRTTNNAEISHDTAKLGRLWQKFYQNYKAHLGENEDIYAIYYNYESEDLVGAFDVVASWQIENQSNQEQSDNDTSSVNTSLAGTSAIHTDLKNTSALVTANISAGRYLVFSEEGRMPNTIMNAWEKAWTYFNDPNCEHTRTFDVDFEHYINGNLEFGQVDLYIGIE